MQIVLMKEEHIDEIVKLEQACFSIPWTKNMFLNELKNPLTTYYIAKTDLIISGYMGMWQVGREGHITNIAVLPAYRRKKIGEQLLTHFVKLSRARDLMFLTLEVRKSNAPAIALYEKIGFSQAGIRKGYYSDTNEDALIMTFNL